MAARLVRLSAVFAVALAAAAPARAALSPPELTSPASGVVVEALPAFAWKKVADADHYEFQFAADAGFNSAVLGQGNDDFFTSNTRATLKKTIPNGTYWWRVRSVDANGGVSPWSLGRSLKKDWTAGASLLAPSSGAGLNFPGDALALSWSAVPGAAHYLVSVATDPLLGSLVVHDQYNSSGAPKVQANTFAIGGALAPGSYFWSITPVDAEGNRGMPSPVASFNWLWPSTTTLRVDDLNDAPEVFDPKFSWDPVQGAARYEVEINPTDNFAPGSKVCCSGTTISTSLSPTIVFKDNTFHWRVRAIDPDGNAGVWNYGPSFTKAFDKVPPVVDTSIKDLRMRDEASDPGVDVDPGTAGYQTHVPAVTWSPVPGASSYEVDVTPYTGALCDWSASSHHWRVNTAVNAWTPLGDGWNGVKPYSDPQSVANEFTTLVPGQYCVRVRARSDRSGLDEVYGAYTYLDPNGLGWAFDWSSYPAGGSCSPSCTANYLGASDYLLPQTGTTVGTTPYFTWKPIAGKQSYYVLVAKDPSFSNIVDYAFTHVPAYAPRSAFGPQTYPDENTSYYWAVLPATNYDGSLATGNPLLAAAQSFQKQSTPPNRLFPDDGHVFLDQPTFRWTPTLGARRYRLQVAQDPSFGNPIDDVTTDSTAYSSDTTYPADTVLYWRVRADDENQVGLNWSTTGTFQRKLAVPVPSPSNTPSGEFLPVWAWSSVQGASSYDISIDQPDGQHRDFSGFRMPAVSFETLTGTGVFHWRVRAEFPKGGYGSVPGPYSAPVAFTRTIGEPGGATVDSGPDHVLFSWNQKMGVKEYRVEISSRPDFASMIEDTRTENAFYAPTMTDSAWGSGKPMYWRVAGVDEDGNQGDFSPGQTVSLLPKLRLVVSGSLKRNRKRRVSVHATGVDGSSLAGVTIRVSGAGLLSRAWRTNRFGNLAVQLKPKRKGTVSFRATKTGYQAAVWSLRVR
jgi:hypothetical protein